MIIGYLLVMCVLAALNVAILSRMNPKNSGFYPSLFLMAFVACVGHLFVALSTNVEEVILANKVNYLGATFLPMYMFLAIISVCSISVPGWIRSALMIFSIVVFGLSATVGFSDIYYTSVEYVTSYGVGNYVATYGPGHAVFNFMLVAFIAADIGMIGYSFARKRSVSFKSLMALSLIEVVSILSFFVARLLDSDTLVMPAVYVFDQFVLLYICYRVKRYDVSLNVMGSLEANNKDGYISISSNKQFLGANEIAYSIFPKLRLCRVDHKISPDTAVAKFFLDWIDELGKGEPIESKEYDIGDRYYKCSVGKVEFTRNDHVHLFKIEDVTELHRYVQMLGNQNDELSNMVKNNASQIKAIQEQMIVGMASMVESRDSNTGGHLKRTSQVVSILVDDIRKSKKYNYTDKFYSALITAAPMHDLGKVAIDDMILRKPGRFTPDEFSIMKTHPEKGAAIVENLLSSVEEPYFVEIAKNVANYHHERWDGTGYPAGLSGEKIPFEARIMAVADVYDALVSRRCYKEKMSYSDAYDIITSSMGTHFDPDMKEPFINCSSKLQAYYQSLD